MAVYQILDNVPLMIAVIAFALFAFIMAIYSVVVALVPHQRCRNQWQGYLI
jgi:hypothetical protein